METEDTHQTVDNGDSQEESRSLRYILGGEVAYFFDKVWQVSCAVFTTETPTVSDAAVQCPWNLERVQDNPVREMIQHGFTVLIDLMEQTHRRTSIPNIAMSENDHESLLFRDRQIVSREERQKLYSYADNEGTAATKTNLWAAFLDGCSVVLNHADLQSPWIAELCADLQRSFPHAYANAYITPAASQAVTAHADDRDVLVVQVHGRKHWTVYGHVPVPYPYPHEQVGKDDLPVPDAVLKGPVLLRRTLAPGDVLYMPRGYVHEAVSCEDCCSFHVTIALATHDWSLAGLLTAASQSVFSQQLDFRKAVDRQWGRGRVVDEAAVAQLRSHLDRAIQMLRDEVTVNNVDLALRNKYLRHNQRAAAVRQPLVQGYATRSATTETAAVVGPEAAATVTLSTWLRAATDVETQNLLLRQQAMVMESTLAGGEAPPQRGLHVREEIYESVSEILQYLKLNPASSFPVGQLRSILSSTVTSSMICDLTLLSMARRCVELGALAIFPTSA